jgi:hypothetical protein
LLPESSLSKGKLRTFFGGFIVKQDLSIVFSLRLYVCIQSFEPLSGADIGHIYNQLFAYPDRRYLRSFFMKSNIRNFVTGIVSESHGSISREAFRRTW